MEAEVTERERTCLTKCADEYVYFDTANYELDTAT